MRKLKILLSKNNNSANRFQKNQINKMSDTEFERLIFKNSMRYEIIIIIIINSPMKVRKFIKYIEFLKINKGDIRDLKSSICKIKILTNSLKYRLNWKE